MQFLGKDPQALTDVLMPVRAARLHEDYLVDAAAASIVGNFILGLQAVVLNRLARGQPTPLAWVGQAYRDIHAASQPKWWWAL
jgi:hypothetical protein